LFLVQENQVNSAFFVQVFCKIANIYSPGHTDAMKIVAKLFNEFCLIASLKYVFIKILSGIFCSHAGMYTRDRLI